MLLKKKQHSDTNFLTGMAVLNLDCKDELTQAMTIPALSN